MRWFGKNRSADGAPPSPGGRETASDAALLSGDDRIDAEKVRTLLDTIGELISTTDPAQVLASIVDKAIRVAGAERGILFLAAEDDAETLRIHVARDADGNDLQEPIQYSTTVTRKVVADGLPMVWKVSSQEGSVDLSRSIVDMRLRAVMCVTLRVKGERLGLIYVDSRATHREFDHADLRFFDALAGALAITVENARLVRDALENERIREQMKIARTIQEGLLPKDPTGVAGLDIAGSSTPAEHALGDYYDFIRLGDGRLAVAIGDVAGHGIGPALLMSSARSLLRSFAHGPFRLEEAFARINAHFEQDTGGAVFMSMFVALFDPGTRSFTWCNAGQTPPLLVRRGTTDPKAIVELKQTGAALGIDADQSFGVEGPVTLEPGDRLVLLTDGMLEARAAGEFYGRERLKRVVLAKPERSAQRLIEAAMRDARAFLAGAKAEDDWTMVVVRAV